MSGDGAHRATAAVWLTMSSIDTGTVESYPSTTCPRLSPTNTIGIPVRSAAPADKASYAVTMTMRSERRFICEM